MRKTLRENGLSLVLLALFLSTFVGHVLTGHRHENDERVERGEAPIEMREYLKSGAFVESVGMALGLLFLASFLAPRARERRSPDGRGGTRI